MQGPEHLIEFFHGYTYSGPPVACAAGLAALEIHARESLFEHAASLAPVLREAVHSLRGAPHVADISNLGLAAAVEREPRSGEPGKRGYDVFLDCYENGMLVRQTGDILAISPPLIVEESQIHQIVEAVAKAFSRVT